MDAAARPLIIPRKITDFDFDIDCNNVKSRQEFKIKLIDTNDKGKILPLLLEYFRTFHLFTPLNLSEEKLLDLAHLKLNKVCPLELSVGVFHKESGNCVGFTFNEIKEKGKSIDHYPLPELAPLGLLFESVYDGFFEDLSLNRFFFTGPGFVLPFYQKFGIAKEILDVTEHVAAASNCDIISSGTTNFYWSRSMINIYGYKIWKETNFHTWRYPPTSEIVYKNVPKPHQHIHNLTKRLSPSMVLNIPLKRNFMTSATTNRFRFASSNRKLAIPTALLSMLTI